MQQNSHIWNEISSVCHGLPLGSFLPELPKLFGTISGVALGGKVDDTPYCKNKKVLEKSNQQNYDGVETIEGWN